MSQLAQIITKLYKLIRKIPQRFGALIREIREKFENRLSAKFNPIKILSINLKSLQNS